MSANSSQDVLTPPDELLQHYPDPVPSTPPSQSTDLGVLADVSGMRMPQRGPPSPPSLPHPPPQPPFPFAAAPVYRAQTEVKLLEALSAEGKLQDVHQILAQYLLAHEPDPITGRLDLDMFQGSISEAIEHQQPVIVSYLFNMRVGKPAEYLFSALKARSTNIFEIFLYYGWDINQTVTQMTPPVLGHVCDDRSLTEWFLANGADVNAGCYLDFTSLSLAMRLASIDTISMLFDRGRGDVHRGQLLHNAVLRKGPESEVIQLITLLLRKGAHINEVQYSKHAPSWALHSPFGMGTPLHYAVEQNKLAVASCLLDNGADPTIADSKGRTVLEVATLRDRDEMEQLLRKHIPTQGNVIVV